MGILGRNVQVIMIIKEKTNSPRSQAPSLGMHTTKL